MVNLVAVKLKQATQVHRSSNRLVNSHHRISIGPAGRLARNTQAMIMEYPLRVPKAPRIIVMRHLKTYTNVNSNRPA